MDVNTPPTQAEALQALAKLFANGVPTSASVAGKDAWPCGIVLGYAGTLLPAQAAAHVVQAADVRLAGPAGAHLAGMTWAQVVLLILQLLQAVGPVIAGS